MKKIFITGASRGIGFEIAKIFVKKGHEVIGVKSSNKTIKVNISDWVVADFNDIEQIKKCSRFIQKFKPDVLINCAGINKVESFEKIKIDTFQKIQKVNLLAPFILCKAAIPNMKKNKWGRITNISSIWGKIGKEYRASYMASKFALDGITLALAAEYSSIGILSNCVAPGFTNTDLTKKTLGNLGMKEISKKVPIRKLASPKEIANFVYWLSSTENSYVSGQNIAIDGGFSRV